jgi:hypothetical protein
MNDGATVPSMNAKAPLSSPTQMQARTVIKHFVIHTISALVIGLLLSGCATGGPDTPDGCYGPPGFCVPYFG